MVDLWLKTLALVVGLAAALFGGAGRLAWPAGWALLGVYAAFIALTLAIVDSDLLKERAAPGDGYDRGDALLATAGFLLLYPVAMAVAGMDAVRFGWGPPVPGWLSVLGGAAFVLGYCLALWAMRANRFFSTFVRIQSDRGHTLVTTGPYAAVRHPGYAGMLLAHFGMPLLLGSWWAFVPVLLGTAVFVVRVLREERLLTTNLEGYNRYCRRHVWRLLPGVW
ncbi:Isoprenylcysteine carboxyl methyltransferase (ICMT) family protein [Posidoniimonas corsicana]|uniref:Isoprenylcysteine carboxyl methyltransferase (ICMT) family protein n=1 Tax=Posidoniimonas corsicana TaxID=1938618 RepID=A0A5C5VDU4_9BACT|nr:isoprenylcysteine carboxylmethyltransferase family protein [Posidoniimonas corsicana]TWT36117.1 Isoprenylcysteine carboxyl methyltransferase (ICMT) family protein [Posidoniimonas corsicana]